MFGEIFTAAIIIILWIPMLLSSVSSFTGSNLDVQLGGYSDSVDKPDLNIEAVLGSDYQDTYAKWFDQNLKPRGILIKSYSSFRYHLFNLGNRIVGYNHDIYEWPYIATELVIDDEPDYSLEENQKEMEEYVSKLVILNDKLNGVGKSLYIYIPASKADFNYANIPDRYKDISKGSSVKSVDYFSNLIRETSLPCLICRDLKSELAYPAFYTSGIHWSRTFEQTVSKRILEDVANGNGRHYRSFELADINKSSLPYWRDDDILKVMNVWGAAKETYYEYSEGRQEKEDYDRIKLLVQGDSFAEGLKRDIEAIYPNERVYYINRAKHAYGPGGYDVGIGGDWEAYDLTEVMNDIDTVIIEAAEPELKYYSHGFVDRLITFIDSYTPSNNDYNYAEKFDAQIEDEWNADSLHVMWGNRYGFSWTGKTAEVIIDNDKVSNRGLEIEFSIPSESFLVDQSPVHVDIYVNGMLNSSIEELQAWDGKIVVDQVKETERTKKGIYFIELVTNRGFRPREVGTNPDDNRELVLKLKYVGEKR